MYILHIFFIFAYLQLTIVHASNRETLKSKRINNRDDCGIMKSDPFSKIVNGERAAVGEFPWLTSLQVLVKNTYRHSCGASVINSNWILTAAHCVYAVKRVDLLIVAGEYDLQKDEGHEQKRSIVKIHYKGYDNNNYENDIALLKLNASLTLDANYVAPICIPQGDETFDRTTIAAGWGLLSENGLQANEIEKVNLPLISYEECLSKYEAKGFDVYMHSCQICTLSDEGKDACRGDSGGPLLCLNKKNNRLYACGVTSWAYGCARRGSPGVFTEVSCFHDWIEEVTNK